MAKFRSMLTHQQGFWITLVVGLSVACILFGVARYYEDNLIHNNSTEIRHAFLGQITQRVNQVIHPLEHFTKRYGTEQTSQAKQHFIEANQDLMQEFAGYQSVYRLNANFNEVWRYPQRQPTAKELTANHEAHLKKVAQSAKRKKQPQFSKVISFPPSKTQKGGRGFIVYIPLYNGEQFKGYITALFHIKELFQDIVDEAALNYSLTLSNNDENFMVIAQGTKGKGENSGKNISKATFYGQPWQLEMWTSDRHYEEQKTFIAEITFTVAVLFTFITITFLRLAKESFKAKEAAEIANRSKSAFLSNMSHEIRTPLTAMLGFSEVLFHDSLPVDERKHCAERIYKNGKHLSELINDILDFAKVEAQKLSVESVSFSLPAILDEVAHIIELQARAKKVGFYLHYIFPLPQTVIGDPTRIKQILINICGNAVKFTKSGYVQLLTCFDKDTQQLIFSITDTGIGIKQSKLKDIFNPFSQEDTSTTRKFGGTGLGLCIAKELAEAMHGSLTVQSTEKLGSRFKAVVGANIPRDTHFATTEIEMHPQSFEQLTHHEIPQLNGHILIAEDWPDNQQLVSLYLRQMGLKYTIVENGQEAVENALALDPDLILMDVQMPVMDGMQATEILLQSGFGNPIIALTANIMKGDREKYEEIGFHTCLAKPIDRTVFEDVLAALLPGKSARDETAKNTEKSKEFLHLAETFKSNLPQRIEDIQTAETKQDWHQVKALIHALKGIGGSFGYQEITEISGKIDNRLKEDLIEQAKAELAKLYQTVDDIFKKTG